MKQRRLKKFQEAAVLWGFLAFETIIFVLMLVPDFRCNYGWIFAFPLFTANILYVAADWMRE